MSRARRIPAAVRANARSFAREPLNVVLVAVLPALSIQIYGVSLGQFPQLGLFEAAGSLETTGRITGAVFATGALAGVLGLFQMIAAKNADRRLVIAGFRPTELVASRFGTVVLLSVAISLVSATTLTALLSPSVASLPVVFVGLTLAGVIYGLLGMIVGTLLPRELEGSLVLVILADVDNVFASGLFGISDSVTRFAPLTHPHELVTRGVLDGALPIANLLAGLSFVLVFGLTATGAYARVAGGDD